ncbi:MAG: hypothetical protein KAI17_09425 [Thiotrichaceae bacterium]|nr:hypothetical protein [Thiotrichaceae bacterium]
MHRIKCPQVGCVAYATDKHAFYKKGANLGDCIDVDGLMAVFSNGDRTFIVYDRDHNDSIEFYGDCHISTTTNVMSIDEYLVEESCNKTDFGLRCSVNLTKLYKWIEHNWIICDGYLYAPRYVHDKYIKDVWDGDGAISFPDLLYFDYNDSAKTFYKKTGLAMQTIHKCKREGWIIFNGTLYNPQKYKIS